MEEARLWRGRYLGELPPREADYLEAVIALGTRAARVRRRAVIATITVLLVLIAAGSAALVSIGRAKREAEVSADLARQEAKRAHDAEAKTEEQIVALRAETAAKQQALDQQAEAERRRKQAEVGQAAAVTKATSATQTAVSAKADAARARMLAAKAEAEKKRIKDEADARRKLKERQIVKIPP